LRGGKRGRYRVGGVGGGGGGKGGICGLLVGLGVMRLQAVAVVIVEVESRWDWFVREMEGG